MNNRKISGKVTPAELAGDVFIAATLTPAQQKEADQHLAEARKKSKANMTEEVRVGLTLFHIRFRIEDYLKNKEYDPKMSFGYFLKEYVDLLNVKRKEFAEQISIDETLLSQLINRHLMPPDYLAIRLELHSNNKIPAEYWYKLVEREKEHYVKTDKGLRRKERKFVHNRLSANL
jgi:plasmid maintenance system antidote protein VapI